MHGGGTDGAADTDLLLFLTAKRTQLCDSGEPVGYAGTCQVLGLCAARAR